MPFRVLDTRINVGAAGPVPFGSTISLSLVPSAVPLNTLGIAGNLTAVNPTSDGWLAIYPGGTPFNNVSNVNYSPTSDPYYAIANFVIVGLGPSGGVTILTNGLSGHVQVLLDIFGYIQ
jgi:hypothetical protein